MTDKYDKVIKKIKRFNSFLDDVTIMSKYELDNVLDLGVDKFEFNVENFVDNNILEIGMKYVDLENSKYSKTLTDLVKQIVVFIKGFIFKYPDKNLKITDVPPELEKYIKKQFDENVWNSLLKDGVGGVDEETEDEDSNSDFGDDDFNDDDFGNDDFGDDDFGNDDFGADDNEIETEEF